MRSAIAIASGDTYQVNHTFRLGATFKGDAFEFYRDLALAQRGGYCAFLDTGRHVIASASPERFFRIAGKHITVKPMKGTIRRGRWPAEDAAFAQRLRASAKDQAENIMIVDLMRNDLGRIARFGSVSADRLLELERFLTVWQLTSEISAELRVGVGLRNVFAAVFPSGSVTGAPKRRTMEIISGLESSSRGVYCGAIGYVAPARSGGLEATFNVAIRTAVLDTHNGRVEYGVGGGITWDSDPDSEYREANLKADILRRPRLPDALLETLRWSEDSRFWLLDPPPRPPEGLGRLLRIPVRPSSGCRCPRRRPYGIRSERVWFGSLSTPRAPSMWRSASRWASAERPTLAVLRLEWQWPLILSTRPMPCCFTRRPIGRRTRADRGPMSTM